MQRLTLIALALLASHPALACKSRDLSPTFPVEELAEYTNVYILHITQITNAQPDSWYAPPFTFEARVVKTLKGTQKPGAIIHGATSSGPQTEASCPIRLKVGMDYLVMLNGQASPFTLPRYGSPFVAADDANFKRLVAQISRYYAPR